MQVGPLEAVTETDFRHAMEVMFWGPLRCTLAVLPQMRARGRGKIVNITSIGGVISVPHMLPYTCAKFAAVGLSNGLRAELASQGVTVTTVIPGLMRLGSFLNVEFRGDADNEYRWFALGATAPGISISGKRAARQIVQAARRGSALRTLGVPAAIVERLSGLMPGTTSWIMSLFNRALPSFLNDGLSGSRRGWEIAQELQSGIFQAATSAGYSDARKTNQVRKPRF
jgi:short-subunit dehydrogenase